MKKLSAILDDLLIVGGNVLEFVQVVRQGAFQEKPIGGIGAVAVVNARLGRQIRPG